jgi:hypothetical protein
VRVLMNCVIAKMAPGSKNDARLIAMEPTAKRGLRRNERFSVGSAVRSPPHERGAQHCGGEQRLLVVCAWVPSGGSRVHLA